MGPVSHAPVRKRRCAVRRSFVRSFVCCSCVRAFLCVPRDPRVYKRVAYNDTVVVNGTLTPIIEQFTIPIITAIIEVENGKCVIRGRRARALLA